MIVCPDCGGRGGSQGVVLVCRRDGSGETSYVKSTCRVCAGAGQVTADRANDYAQGRADRERRVHAVLPYKTLGERAAELGISRQELSRWENYGERWEGFR